MNCNICNEEIPDYIYIEENEEEWTCPECILKNHMKCSICNENIGITNIDRANGMLGDDWIEMCENCALEFKKNVSGMDRIS